MMSLGNGKSLLTIDDLIYNEIFNYGEIIRESTNTNYSLTTISKDGMYLINNNLGIDAIVQTMANMRYVDAVVGKIDDFQIVDVRMLKENQKNSDAQYLLNIVRATAWLQCNQKVVICSGAARSRSPAIATGVLFKFYKMTFNDALELIMNKVPSVEIDNIHIISIKKIFGVTKEKSPL
jgi:hypothetical protein